MYKKPAGLIEEEDLDYNFNLQSDYQSRFQIMGLPLGNSCEDIDMLQDEILTPLNIGGADNVVADPILAELSFIGEGEVDENHHSALKLFAQPSN